MRMVLAPPSAGERPTQFGKWGESCTARASARQTPWRTPAAESIVARARFPHARSIQRVITFEHHSEPLLPKRAFFARLLRSGALTLALLLFALGVGVFGYRALGGLAWLDALVNASMILSGMGVVDHIKTDSGKWFESIYALFSGIAFMTSVGVLLAPALHRLIHKLHAEGGAKRR